MSVYQKRHICDENYEPIKPLLSYVDPMIVEKIINPNLRGLVKKLLETQPEQIFKDSHCDWCTGEP